MIAGVLLSLCAIAAPGGDTVVVSRAQAADARWAEAMIELRAAAVARGLGIEPAAALQPVLEGRAPPKAPFSLDLSPVEEAYRNFEFDAADRIARSLTAEVLTRAAPDELADHLVELLRWHGVVAVAANQLGMAQTIFTLRARLAPERGLDPAVVPPPVIEQYRRAVARAHVDGRLHVTVEPAGATATLDGEPVRVGEPVSVEGGPHLLVVSCIGFVRHARIVVVKAGELTKLDLVLPQQPTVDLVRELVDRLGHDSADAEAISALTSATSARRVLLVEPVEPDLAKAGLHDATGETIISVGPVPQAQITDLLTFEVPVAAEVTPLVERGWFWGGVGGAAALAVAGALVAVFVPRSLEVCVARDEATCN